MRRTIMEGPRSARMVVTGSVISMRMAIKSCMMINQQDGYHRCSAIMDEVLSIRMVIIEGLHQLGWPLLAPGQCQCWA